MGRELQNCGCDVYKLLADNLNDYPKGYFSELIHNAGSKTVVVIVDEVQHNLTTSHWDSLLKGSKPTNLLVLGVGIFDLS